MFLFEAEAVVCRRIVFPKWSRTSYRAELHGEPADPSATGVHALVKAATYHGLAVVQDEDGWRARVILDV